jgi:hypothetical protein
MESFDIVQKENHQKLCENSLIQNEEIMKQVGDFCLFVYQKSYLIKKNFSSSNRFEINS